jgi:hypothetical protein
MPTIDNLQWQVDELRKQIKTLYGLIGTGGGGADEAGGNPVIGGLSSAAAPAGTPVVGGVVSSD